MKTLVALGATRSYIDPIRFITNPSSGKMGMALVEVAQKQSEEVFVVIGTGAWETFKENQIFKEKNVHIQKAQTVEDFLWAIFSFAKQSDILFMVAAISDYIMKQIPSEKIKKKSQEKLTLELERGPDIISLVRQFFPSLFICGFCAETQSILENAKQKRKEKNLDMLFVNNVSGQVKGGFGSDGNQGYLLAEKGEIFMPFQDKKVLAQNLWNEVKKEYKIQEELEV